MASATDIITYIGIPLAVLGVLPILYTFTLSFLTRRRIRSLLLRYGHRPTSNARPHDGFSIRGSPMTGSIEVELPRYTIAPLERQQEEFWQTTDSGFSDDEHHHLLEHSGRADTTMSVVEEGRVGGYLRGGTWRAFNWKRLLVGRKLYRIQYEDELREPPAEISFEDLVTFLLDWGAIPDALGWEKLRSGGLWTPSGTVLLRQPHPETDETEAKTRGRSSDWVLRTSMSDESDGILSLTIRWTTEYIGQSVQELRGATSLPPGWGRLTQPLLEVQDQDLGDKKTDIEKLGKDSENSQKSEEEKQADEKVDLPTRILRSRVAHKHSMDSTSFRFHFDGDRVHKVYWEKQNRETGCASDPFRTFETATAGIWFTCAASALLSSKMSSNLWAFEMPSDIKHFARKDSVPCGVMVLLGFLSEEEAPQWSFQKPESLDGANMARKHHNKLMVRLAAEREEASMPPAQAQIHRSNRIRREMNETHDDMMAEIQQRQDREERRIKDAIVSPKMSARKVAEACLRWLIESKDVGKEWTVEQLAEAVLYLLVLELQNGTAQAEGEVAKIIKVLNEWTDWAAAGGMKMQQYYELNVEKEKVAFCFAASLVAVVADALNSDHAGVGKVGADMMECLKLWRKVRLG
jgi:hypothetical protein